MKQIIIVTGLVLFFTTMSCNGTGQRTGSDTSSGSSSGSSLSKFHACNYDGSAYNGTNMATLNATAEGEAVVEKILEFTGLPQNFKVQIGEVPNAAAVILQESDGSLGRYILYNPDFMKMVDDRTKNNWAGISILAHEIGHHLSGHTLLPGGSQPSIELEADKFSGYVLYKMGANIKEAQIAMNTLVGDADGDTHPGRPKRLQAILDGWQQACKQAKGQCSTDGGEQSSPASTEIVLNNDTPDKVSQNMTPELPAPKTNDIPLKFDRFVYDEAYLLTDEQEKEFSDKLMEVATKSGAEVVILCPKSLGGLSIQQYASAMMEKMRIGKMDLANGAVYVIAEGQVSFIVQPGLYWVMGQSTLKATIDDMITASKDAEDGDQAYQALRYGVAAVDVFLNTGVHQWKMDFPTLADAKKVGDAAVGKITRVVGTVGEATSEFAGDGIKVYKFNTTDGEQIKLEVMEDSYKDLPQGAKAAIVGRMYDMKYGVTLKVLSAEPMR